MQPINFSGARIIGKPENMTDEQCMSIYASSVDTPAGKDKDGNDLFTRMWIECWKPSKEDIDAINRGEPVWLQIHSIGLPPIAVFTLDENGKSNDAG